MMMMMSVIIQTVVMVSDTAQHCLGQNESVPIFALVWNSVEHSMNQCVENLRLPSS